MHFNVSSSDKMFEDIRDPALFEVIVDCIVNFLRQPTTLSYPNTVWSIIAKVRDLCNLQL